MIRTVVADDHPVVRMGVIAVLECARGIDVVGEAHSSTALMALLDTTGCDVLITDYSMPDDTYGDGLRMLEKLRRRYPGLAIIVLTMVSNPAAIQAMAALGCKGICDKRAPLVDCVRAIRAIRSGKRFHSAAALRALSARRPLPDIAPTSTPGSATFALTPKEVDVVRLVAEGLTVEQIAGRLHRSPKTVSAQKRGAMARMGVTSDEALMRYAYESGLAWR